MHLVLIATGIHTSTPAAMQYAGDDAARAQFQRTSDDRGTDWAGNIGMCVEEYLKERVCGCWYDISR